MDWPWGSEVFSPWYDSGFLGELAALLCRSTRGPVPEGASAAADLTCACSGALCCSHFHILRPHWACRYAQCGPRARQGHWRRGTAEFLMPDLRWTAELRYKAERAQEHLAGTTASWAMWLATKIQLARTPTTIFADLCHCRKHQRKLAVDSNDKWASVSRLKTRNKELKIQKNVIKIWY